mmetsp:Transcript_5741/g.18786  ORF Transcript_5741/g.18786 Transcript_5741/m.18786 type:complete len:203 (+) Transcript_5741:478-1086(+)
MCISAQGELKLLRIRSSAHSIMKELSCEHFPVCCGAGARAAADKRRAPLVHGSAQDMAMDRRPLLRKQPLRERRLGSGVTEGRRSHCRAALCLGGRRPLELVRPHALRRRLGRRVELGPHRRLARHHLARLLVRLRPARASERRRRRLAALRARGPSGAWRRAGVEEGDGGEEGDGRSAEDRLPVYLRSLLGLNLGRLCDLE